ncbi:DNA topoisomerase IV alpha subunit [Mucidula mucida]|nr:DNA topoisomerase IV alpha subunit [Mucidula mucida]
MSFPMKSRILRPVPLLSNCHWPTEIATIRPDAKKYLSYPRKSATGSVRAFAQLFRVVDSMHESIRFQMTTTKRDIYYKDVPLFKSQRTVDALVDDVAATLDLERSQLRIRATSKGLICGSALSIGLESGSTIQPSDSEGSLIPVGEDIKSFDLNEPVSFVLIVEKDAIFQQLSHLNITNHPMLPGRGLLVTGKGYPDMATRHLVKTLADNLPLSVPILALVDGDSYGLDILSVYKYGSRALQHENNKLAAERIEWLGLFASELSQLGIDPDSLIPISKYDEKKAHTMLQRRLGRTALPVKWRKELMRMLYTRRKAEIEILYTATSDPASPDDLCLEPSPPNSSFLDSGPPTSHSSAIPLLRYLSTKITASVAIASSQVC